MSTGTDEFGTPYDDTKFPNKRKLTVHVCGPTGGER